MDASQLTIAYAGRSGAVTAPWVRLAQEPVSSAPLTDEDLHIMLAMVRSGVSARAYRPRDCAAYVAGNQAMADLAVHAWPSALDLPYTLLPELVTAEAPTLWKQEREFDLVVAMSASASLPCVMEHCTLDWQTPCYNRRGVQVPAPMPALDGTTVRLDAEVFGVLRVRGVAVGYRHGLRFAMAKTGASAISDIKPAVAVFWRDSQGRQSKRLELALPACLTDLLALCPDGGTVRDHQFVRLEEDEETVPVVYYSPCSGGFLAVRYERP